MDIRSPRQITSAAADAGLAKAALRRNIPRLLLLAILAGAYIALGGILSVYVGFGFPEASAGNPALQKFLSGATFPVGLILVVVLGAELFTGNNALLIPTFMQRRASASDVAVNWTIVYFGNFIGAVLFVVLLVWIPGLLDSAPYSSAITGIAIAKCSMPWTTVFLKAIGANWCVCLAVWLALSGHNLIEKMAGCWFPVMAFVVLGYEHCIANMFFIPAGMLQGAPIGISTFVTANLIPATLGNIVGGALFVGCLYGYLHLSTEKDK